MKRFLTMLVGAAVLGIGATSAQAQAAPGSSWLAWYGCWRSSGEPSAPGETVCVLPGENAASARFVTIEDGRIAQETEIHADGVARPVEEGGCAGSQSATFSPDGRRVYTRSDLSCSNSPRVTTGVLGFAGDNRWVDSQALTVRDQHAARSIVYEFVGSAGMPPEVVSALPTTLRLAQEAARLDVSAPLGIDEILDAAGRLAPPALDGFLAAGESPYDFDARDLVRLRDGGVSPSTIDVIVAVSYPERFAVRSREELAEPMERVAMRDAMIQNYCYDPFWSGRFSDCYNSFGYANRYGSFGYSPWGYDPYGWRYSRDPVFVIVEPENQGGGTVDGIRGYTPGPSSSPGSATRRDGSEPVEAPRPSSSPRTSEGPSDSGGSSSGGGYTPSGDDSSSSGRRARPRGSSE